MEDNWTPPSDAEVTDWTPPSDAQVIDEPVKKKVTPSPLQTQSSSNGLNLLSGVIPSGKALLTGQKEESAPTEQKQIDLTNAPIAEDESTRTDKFIRKPIDKKKVDEIYTLSKQNESLVDEFSKSHFVLDKLSQTESVKQLNDLYAKREQAKDQQTAQAIDNQIEVLKSQPIEKQPSIQEAILQNAQKYGSQPQDFSRPEIPMNPLTPNQILERNGMKTANTVGELHDRYIESATKLNELRPELDKTATELDAFKKDARTVDFKTDKSGNKTLEGLADIPEAFGHGFGGTMKSIEQGFVNLLGDKQDRIDYAKKRYLEDNILYPTRTKGMATSGAEMVGGVAPYVISTAVLPETALLGHVITNGLTMGASGYGNGYYEMFAKQKQQGASDEEADAIAMQNAKFEGAKETAIGASLPFMGGAGSKLFLAPAEKSAMKQFLATQGVIIPTFTAGKLASNTFQKYGLGEKDVNLGDGLAETAENGLILGAMMEFAHKAPPKLKELYRANLSEQYPSIQQSVDKAVKDGVMDASQGYVFTEKLKRDFAVFNAMPKDITTEQKLAIEPEVKQIIELSSREQSAVESPEVTKDKIVQLQKQVAEKLGTPLTEKEMKSYEKLQEIKGDKEDKLTPSEKLELNHYEKRIKTAEDNDVKLAEEKKVAEAETHPTNVGVEAGSVGVGGDVKYTEEQTQEYKQRGFEQNDNGIWVHKGTNPVIKKVLNGWVGKLFAANGGTHAGNIHKEGSGIAGSLGKFNFKTGKTPFLDLVFGKDKTDSDYFVTLSHEMGHDVFERLTPEERAIIEKNQNLTDSAKAHKENRDNKGELENNASDAEESWSDYVSAFLGKKLFDVATEEYNAIPKEILPILEANVKIPKEVLSELGVEQSLKETPKTETTENPALKDVESTTKALEGKSSERLIPLFDVLGEVQNSEFNKQQAIDVINTEIEILPDDIRNAKDKERKEQLQQRLDYLADAKNKEKEVDDLFKELEKDSSERLLNSNKKVAEAYHKAKKDGSNPELVKAVEQSLKETTQSETKVAEKGVEEPTIEATKTEVETPKTKNVGVEEGSGGVGGDVVGKTFRDNYNRTFEVKGENAGILTLEDVDTGKVLRKKKSEVLSDFKEITEPDVVDKTKTITEHLPKGGELKGVTEIDVSENGEEVSYGTKTRKTSITVKGLSAEEIKQEIKFEKQVLERSKRDAANFNEDEIRSAKGMTRQEKEDAIKMHKQSLINNEQVEKIVIPFYEKHLEIAEQSLKETTKAETPTKNVGVEEGSGGVGGEEKFTAKGGNKVVDEKGEPITVYHTTKAENISEFKTSGEIETLGGKVKNEGAYFTPIKGEYANKGGNEYAVQISIRNPYITTDQIESAIISPEKKAELISKGHDGVILMRNGKPAEYVVFDKSQIKQSLKETTQSETKVAEKGVEEPITEEIKTAIDNGEITREQADDYIKNNDGAKSESTIEDIERKAESENKAELNEAIDQADKLIGEAVGATKSEKQPTDKGTSEDKVTGITKAVQEQEWKELGVDSDFANQLSRDWDGTVLKEAKDKIKANPYIAETLAKELNDNPRPTTDTENAILLIEKRRLQNLFDEHYNDTSEDKNPIALLAIQDKLIENMNAIEGAGTKLGQGLNSLKMLMAKDYSLATMLAKKRLANDNKPLTPEVEKQITDLHEKITELQKKFDDYVEQKKKESEITDAENGLNRAKRDVRKNNRNLTREKLKAERDVIVSNIKDKVATLLESAVEKTGGKLNAVENKVNNKEVLSSLSLEISNLVKNLVEDKVLDLADIVDNIHDELKGIIPDLSKREVRDAISGYGKEPQKQTKSEIQSEIDRLKKEAKQLSKQEDIESGKIDGPRLKALKNRIKELQEKNAKGDYSKKEKKVYELDDVALNLKAELDREKAKFSKGLQQDALSKRTLGEKGLDALAQWSRAIKLSGIVTLGKLTAAAAERVVITPAEEAVGGVLSKIFPKLSAKAEREGGINAKIEAQAISKGFMKGMADSWRILTTGESNLDVSYGKQDNLPHSVLDFFGHLHGALKAVPKRIEFERSFAKRMEAQAKKGIDVSNPLVQTKTAIQAYKDSKRAIFMQDNIVASAWSNFIKSLESKNKTTGEDNKVIATIGKTLLPFVKIPTNIVGETLTYAGGSVSGSYKLAKALTKGIENVSPEEADVVLRHLKKGSLGLGLLALGFFNPQAIGGYYQKYEKRREGEPEAGEVELFGHKIPKFLVHNPLLECLQIGATVRRVSDTYTKGKENTKTSGLMAGLLGIADEVPFVKTGESLKGALESEHEATYFLGSYLKGMIDPALLQDIARFTDKDENGKVKKRETDTVLEHIESGLPFLRQSLPEKEQKNRAVTTPLYDEKGKLLQHGRTR